VADVEALLEALTLEEKASLTAGEDMFSTAAVDRVGIPKIRVTDGPAGAKGLSFPGLGGDPSTGIPCGSAIGATWAPDTAQKLGALVGREALDRGCRGLLAPTVNLHRSPLAGRNFECFSEDPLLSGRMAVGYVRGVQSVGVFATVKHFVANDAEFERNTISSVVDERSLRELYLVPFEMAVREGGALAIMTAYNRLNGKWLTERPDFLLDILREEWGFQGLVMTDWFAVVNRGDSLRSGLDLEMPGPGRALGSTVMSSIEDGLVDKADLDAAVARLLGGLDRIGALDAPTPPIAAVPPGEEDLALVRAAAAEATVLLSNDGVLPLDTGAIKTLAVIGAPARSACMGGGGSAQVVPHRAQVPLDKLRQALGGGLEVRYERGCDIDRSATVVGGPVLPAPDGFVAEIFEGTEFAGPAVRTRQLDELRLFVFSMLAQDYPSGDWSLRANGTLVPEETGRFELALAQSGRARVFLDGRLVLDGFSNPPAAGGSDFFGQASQDLVAEVEFSAGVPVEVAVEYTRSGASLAGFRVGFRTMDSDGVLDRAVAAASSADAAVVFVGTNHGWESEGFDRSSFQLPGRQDEMVGRIAAANRRTVVVVSSGAPVDMPWAGEVAAVLQVWFGGQEMDAAIADVITGRSEPGGRLPTTIPRRIEHNPSYDNFPGENGELRYGEGLFMGYRGYEHRAIEPRFAFGHGLSYTSFEFGEPVLSSTAFRPGEQITVTVPVRNSGERPGSEVVQCYIAPRSPRLARPLKELKGFAKLRLGPGESADAEIVLEDRAFAYWDPGQRDRAETEARIGGGVVAGLAATGERREPGWQIDPGDYEVLVGRSSADILARRTVTVI
jgi:beta-glucosidase